MRSLHLTFESKSTASIIQRAWEIWFTLSVILLFGSLVVETNYPNTIDISTFVYLACHFIVSTFVGLFTYED